MKDKINIGWVYAGAILFIAINAFFIYKEFFFFSIAPIVLLLVVAAFLSLDKLLLAVVFMVPLSVPLGELAKGLPIDMYLPTEPLLAGILLLFFIKIFYEKQFDKQVLFHPISIAIYFYLAWMLITALTSTMPVVSIKYFVSKLWFIVAFYFLATQLFKNTDNARRYIIFYVYALLIVIAYALTRHAIYGITEEKIAHWAANPFYKDHTSYGAILAMYSPLVIGMAFFTEYSVRRRFVYFGISFIMLIALVFSYSRAAWLSLLLALGVRVLIKFKIKFSVIVIALVVFVSFIGLFGEGIMRNLESNNQESSTNLAKHIKSISNVSSDASNLERLNRWNCAIRLFKEKPIFGWGPGTYMFQYGPYQISSEKTIISTREGNMGNAHSEYLGPLAEQGFLGTISILIIVVLTLITGLRVIKQTDNREIKMLGLVAILGLITYYLHGIVNNFLDTDKASVPFWGFTALIVAIDVYHKRNESINIQE